MERWLAKFDSLTPEQQKSELFRVEKEFYLPTRTQRYAYCPDLSFVPGDMNDSVQAGDFDEREMSEKIKALVQFIRQRFGKRCARAAIAVMSGCHTGAEIGAHMGISRQAGDQHLEKIQSKVVQRKAVQLGLVTRQSFISKLEFRGRPRKFGSKRRRPATARAG
jgi:hypothetical protein